VAPEVTQWLSHLESRQQELAAQTQAQAEQQAKAVEDLKKTAVADVKKNSDWLSRVSLFGDIRLRHEGFYQDGVDSRNQERFRLRLGARIQISDELEGGLRLVSGDPNTIGGYTILRDGKGFKIYRDTNSSFTGAMVIADSTASPPARRP